MKREIEFIVESDSVKAIHTPTDYEVTVYQPAKGLTLKETAKVTLIKELMEQYI